LKFDGQLGTWLKQSKTKDQTGKSAKIKESNYNSSGGLDYKIVKNPRTESKIFIWILKRCSFLKALFIVSFKKPFSAVKTEICFAAKAPNCSNYGTRFMAVIPLFPYYKATVTTAGLSLAYKSQRKTMNRR
jgi:hypothetical protein